MRLNLTPPLSTKDGVSAKNARLTNCLKESKKSGDKAVIRPGLVLDSTYPGVGNGLIPFDGRLLTIYNNTVYDDDLFGAWPFDSIDWSAATTYGYGDTVWYGGVMFFSKTSSNTNRIPSVGSSYWSTSASTEWNASVTPDFNDWVLYNGTRYYAGVVIPGQAPSLSSPHWGTTSINTGDAANAIVWGGQINGGPGGGAAYKLSDAIAWVQVSPTTRNALYYGTNPDYSGRTF